jgi:Zn-dependent M28 family amino/carboxypeptidase
MSRIKRSRGLAVWGLPCLVAIFLTPLKARNIGAPPIGFSGARAFDFLDKLVAFGPRPSGSKSLAEARQWMVRQLKQAGAEVEADSFVAATPVGDVPMTNVIAKFPGTRGDVVILGGHYDTKRFEDFAFVGANDGGSSAAFLLEMARVLGRRKNAVTIWLVFFDGEEAVLREWSRTDSLYGSRHLVEKLTAKGKLSTVKAMILVDMIGDAKLAIHRESNSTAWLNDLVFNTAHRLGLAQTFLNEEIAIEDDHVPFLNAGVSAIDLIDLDYGPNNTYWHSAQDTLDHCSAASLSVVGRVVTATLEELEKSPKVR